jgi:hypothetical protein
MNSVWFAAVGMPFRGSKPQELKEARVIKLVSEPDNKYDPEAIKILIEGENGADKHVGYVSRKDTARVKPFLDKQYSIVVLETYKRSAELCLEHINQSAVIV